MILPVSEYIGIVRILLYRMLYLFSFPSLSPFNFKLYRDLDKKYFDNTMTQFCNMITKWFLGTGGGDGCLTLLENWDVAKLERYEVDPEDCDHTNMAAHPSILIDICHNH